MTSRHSYAWVVAGLLCLGAVGWFLRGYSTRGASEVLPLASGGDEFSESASAQPRSEESARQVPAASVSDPQQADAEPPRSAAALILRVLDTGGVPIEGAELSWQGSALEPGADLALLSGASSPPAPILALSDGKGEVDWALLRGLADGLSRSAIWVTHPGHGAQGIPVGENLPPPREVVLAGLEGLAVRVLDNHGNGLEGSLVFTAAESTPVDADGTDSHAHLLVRTASTDSAGRARLPHLAETQWVVAFHGAGRSTVRRVRAPAEVSLVVGEVFTAEGRVRIPPAGPTSESVRVRAGLEESSAGRWLAQARLRPDGTWGPMSVARTDARELVLRADGGDLVPHEQRVPMPQAGAHLVVDFEPVLGCSATVRVRDLEDKNLVGAAVEIWWQEDSVWKAAYGTTDAEGLARVGGCVPGHIWIRALKRGYLSSTSPDPHGLSEGSNDVYEVRLAPAGEVRGRVLVEGQPVPTFRVFHWDVKGASHRSSSFTERPDGTFVLKDVPLGPLEISARAPGYAASATVALDLGPSGHGEVTLELRAEGSCSGRVVHALSGEPIPNAQVALYIERDQVLLEAAGPLAVTDEQGYFVLGGLSPGINRFGVTAPGFDSRIGVADARAEVEVQSGTVAMAPVQELSVHLVGESVADPTAYRVELKDSEFHALRPFDPQGIARFERVGFGHHSLRVHDPAGIWIDEDLHLVSGEQWVVEVEVDAMQSSGIDVELDLEGAPADLMEPGMNIHVSTEIDGRPIERWLLMPETLRRRIPGPFGDELVVQLFAGGSQLVGSRRVRTEDHRTNPVRLRCDQRGVHLRVLDAQGDPAGGVWIQVFVPGDAVTWRRSVRADFEGRFHLRALPAPPLVFTVAHSTHGISAGQRIDFEPDDREVVVRLSAKARLSLSFLDGQLPLSNVVSELQTLEGSNLWHLGVSGSSGETQTPPLAAGSYNIVCRSPGLWPARVPLEMGATDRATAIQLRRLGALKVRVEAPAGVALGGARLEFFSEEFAASVADWLKAGRIQAGASGLVSDAEGDLRLFALPHGAYRWTLHAPGAEPLAGQVTVPPHAQGELVIVVQL